MVVQLVRQRLHNDGCDAPVAETLADGVQMRGGCHVEGIVFRQSDGAVRHAAGKGDIPR